MSMQGTWTLTAVAASTAEAENVEEWLRGSGRELATRPASGLQLTIGADGQVEESTTGPAHFEWYDQDGVLEAQAVPFAGQLTQHEGRCYLSLLGEPGPLRCDDGDTRIADLFEVTQDGKLLRTTNVATDELYLNRQVYVYSKA